MIFTNDIEEYDIEAYCVADGINGDIIRNGSDVIHDEETAGNGVDTNWFNDKIRGIPM